VIIDHPHARSLRAKIELVEIAVEKSLLEFWTGASRLRSKLLEPNGWGVSRHDR
jgi:hypothetical protein